MALRYRELQAPTVIQPGYYDGGSREAAAALSDTLGAFGKLATDYGVKQGTARGEQAGAQAGASGNPDFKKGMWLMTAYGQAFNNSAMRSYAIKSEADAEDQAARLEVQSADNPDTFRQLYGQVAQETLKHAPPEARAVLTDLYNKRMIEGVARLSRGQATEYNKQARSDLAEGIGRSTDRIARLRSTDDPTQHALADQEEAKLGLMIDGSQRDGTLSAVEAQALHKDAYDQAITQTVQTRFDNELGNPYGDPVKFIQNLQEQNKTSDILSPEQEDKLTGSLFAQLRDRNALRTEATTAQRLEREQRWQEGEKTATELWLGHRLNNTTLLRMVSSGDLDPGLGRILASSLTSAASEGPSDPRALMEATLDLDKLDERQLLTYPGLSRGDRESLIKKRAENATGWRATQQAREGEQRIDRSLGIAPGTMTATLSDAQKTARQRAMTSWYNQVDALPPLERQAKAISISEDVISTTISTDTQLTIERKMQSRQAVIDEYAKLGDLDEEQQKQRQLTLDALDSSISRLRAKVK